MSDNEVALYGSMSFEWAVFANDAANEESSGSGYISRTNVEVALRNEYMFLAVDEPERHCIPIQLSKEEGYSRLYHAETRFGMMFFQFDENLRAMGYYRGDSLPGKNGKRLVFLRCCSDVELESASLEGFYFVGSGNATGMMEMPIPNIPNPLIPQVINWEEIEDGEEDPREWREVG